MTDIWLVETTVGNVADAARLSRAAIDARLAACVQRHAVESCYFWDGTMQEDSEIRLVFKTDAGHIEDLLVQLRKVHPYQVPELLAYRAKADSRYAGWLAETLAVGTD